jgi:hypothetical protein
VTRLRSIGVGYGRAVGEILHLALPLTPTANECRRWNRWRWAQHRKAYGAAVRLAYTGARPWAAEMALVAYVRCGDGTRPSDPDNVIIGCKAALDAVVSERMLRDDSPQHVEIDRVVSLSRVGWSDRFGGPATHIILSRVTRDFLFGRDAARALLSAYLREDA